MQGIRGALASMLSIQQQGSTVGSPNLVFVQCELGHNYYYQFLGVCALPVVLTLLFAVVMACRTAAVRAKRIHEERVKLEFEQPVEQERDHRAQLAGDDDELFDLVAEFQLTDEELDEIEDVFVSMQGWS